MNYFNPAFLTFLEGLKSNNNREWFNANKETYTKEVAEPFKLFVGDLIDALSDVIPGLYVTPGECIFRIHKDVRFSKDKTPYKTHVSAYVSRNGKKDTNSLALYIQMASEDVRLYSGFYSLTPKQVEKLRSHIFDNLEEFNSIINNPSFKDTFGEIHGEKYKRVPEPFSQIAAQQPLILNKSFYYFKKYDPQFALEESIIETLVRDYEDCIPLNDFLREGLEE